MSYSFGISRGMCTGLLFVVSLSAAGCQSWDKFWVDGAFTSFTFETAHTRLAKSYVGTITGDQISVAMPYGPVSNSLIATFTNGSTVYVGNTPQQSGATANDFTSPVTYTIKLPGGAIRSYTVSIYRTTPIPDTGQSNCYDNNTQQPCSTTAATFPGQDADYVNTPSARGIQSQSNIPAYPADLVNIDTAAGLTWKACDEGLSGAACATGTASTPLFNAAVNACSALNSANSGAGYAGRTDWRLPHFRELVHFSLFDLVGGWVDTATFPGAASVNRWSSSLILPAASNALSVNGQMASTLIGTNRTTRCVSGGNFPAADWKDNGDGTVLDNRSGIYHQKCSNGQANDTSCSGAIGTVTWQNALSYCNNLTLAGRKWRLPNVNELVGLVDLTRTATPYINPTYFPGVPADGANQYYFWASTTNVPNPLYANLLDFSNLSIASMDTKNNAANGAFQYVARCVSGP